MNPTDIEPSLKASSAVPAGKPTLLDQLRHAIRVRHHSSHGRGRYPHAHPRVRVRQACRHAVTAPSPSPLPLHGGEGIDGARRPAGIAKGRHQPLRFTT